MTRPALPLGVAAILAVAMSAAAGGGVIYSGQRIEFALALAGLVLAATQLVIFLYRDLYYRRRLAAMGELHQRGRKLAERLAALTTRVDVLEGSRDERPAARSAEASDFNREFEELRRSIERLAGEYVKATPAASQRREPALPPQRDDEQRREEPRRDAEERPAVAHQLEFYLEPIVSLNDDVTRHYRASLVLEGQGHRVAYEELTRQAAANGLRPDLDGHAVSRALSVGHRLAAKRPDTCVFVPVGPETLASREALSAIEWQMTQAGDRAAGIIFEIDHATMAALSPRGIEGLARIARFGSGLALSRAHGMGIDLDALRDLQFRCISFSAAALPEAHAVPAWAETSRSARDYGFSIGVQGLFYPEQVDIAGRWAELGSGPVFAPPRRVKGDAVSIDRIRSAA
ncbi:EAL domain-containing protein [Taklimakanibacter lacteus]|uniref:EAL domain-containing protein n=1 Tax=Taklimakanibacter lacteus TaxID=2268456 RepID=UPI000E66F079